jgi:hypothetical protein
MIQSKTWMYGILLVLQEKLDNELDLYGIDFDPALTACLKDKCELWRNGECIQIRKVANQRTLV